MSYSDKSALIVVDVQNDFCTGGALAVPGGEQVIYPINGLISEFSTVIFTQDWHPKNHSSFASNYEGKSPFDMINLDYGAQVLWPDHCVEGTFGAEFHSEINSEAAQLIIRKGFRADIDSYSAFFENDQKTTTGLAGYLKDREIERVFLCGLATDFCVLYSALDARKCGFDAVLFQDACRGIDMDGSLGTAMNLMQDSGVIIE